jgi:hypothetical protein
LWTGQFVFKEKDEKKLKKVIGYLLVQRHLVVQTLA